MDLETALKKPTETDPPLPEEIPQEIFDKMTIEECADYFSQIAQANVARYAGRPELLLKENPHRDFRKFEKKDQNPAE